jgi:hypothetical protein
MHEPHPQEIDSDVRCHLGGCDRAVPDFLDINPFTVHFGGCVAVDALVVWRG